MKIKVLGVQKNKLDDLVTMDSSAFSFKESKVIWTDRYLGTPWAHVLGLNGAPFKFLASLGALASARGCQNFKSFIYKLLSWIFY